MQTLINRGHTRYIRVRIVGGKLVYAGGGSDAFMEMTRAPCSDSARLRRRDVILQFSTSPLLVRGKPEFGHTRVRENVEIRIDSAFYN